ncbi:MAG: hypothetical protein NZ551_03825 [Microscillaceae bacterium]|nr:hypothetical protein [Microscillaceae bacterium]MDW8460318.1 hypothetical protein [Cytophagales bacterium]
MLSFSIIVWIMLKSMRGGYYPPNNDDEGGISNQNFPIIDLPPGGQIQDLLVDRWHGDKVTPKRWKQT